jgi:hypothetical protein
MVHYPEAAIMPSSEEFENRARLYKLALEEERAEQAAILAAKTQRKPIGHNSTPI